MHVYRIHCFGGLFFFRAKNGIVPNLSHFSFNTFTNILVHKILSSSNISILTILKMSIFSVSYVAKGDFHKKFYGEQKEMLG